MKNQTQPDLSIIKQYTDMGTALIGVYDSGAVIAKGDDLKQAYTADFTQIKSLGNAGKSQAIVNYDCKVRAEEETNCPFERDNKIT